MKISGFSFARNAVKLYYPVAESIQSILPICDEFVIAVGCGDADDRTSERIEALGDPRIRIIRTSWEEKHFQGGISNALQTDVAMQACSGDWLFYLQADEVVHEQYLPAIAARCRQLFGDDRIEGLVFGYKHFWGDYDHYHQGHGWYPHEIRIIRKREDIHSWVSAQSFRRFEHYEHPRQKEGTAKLRVAAVDAEIYHYGWVRPPHLMQDKRKALDSVHWGVERMQRVYSQAPRDFDYGPLDRLAIFTGTHPQVMEKRIAEMNWKEQLQYGGKSRGDRAPHKHERAKYRALSFLERHLTQGGQMCIFRNYELIKDV